MNNLRWNIFFMNSQREMIAKTWKGRKKIALCRKCQYFVFAAIGDTWQGKAIFSFKSVQFS